MAQQTVRTSALPRWALYSLVGVIGVFAGFGMRLVWAQGVFNEPGCDPLVAGPAACNAVAPVLKDGAAQTITSPITFSGTGTLTASSTIAASNTITLSGAGRIINSGSTLQPVNITTTGAINGMSATAINGSAIVAQTTGTGDALVATVSGTGRAANLTGPVLVTGSTNLTGALTVTGNTSHTGTLAVSGATTLSSTLNVSGATTISNSLAVDSLTVGGQPFSATPIGEVTSLVTKRNQAAGSVTTVDLKNELAWPSTGRRVSSLDVLYLVNDGTNLWKPLPIANLQYQEYQGSCLTSLALTNPSATSTSTYRIAVTYYSGTFNCASTGSPTFTAPNLAASTTNPAPNGPVTLTATTSVPITPATSVSFYGNGVLMGTDTVPVILSPNVHTWTFSWTPTVSTTVIALATNGPFTTSSGTPILISTSAPPPVCSPACGGITPYCCPGTPNYCRQTVCPAL